MDKIDYNKLVHDILDQMIESEYFVLNSEVTNLISEKLKLSAHLFKGDPGPDGKPGFFPVARPWKDSKHTQGEVVIHNGSTWQSACDTDEEPGKGATWFPLASNGKRGVSVKSAFIDDGQLVVVFDNGDLVKAGHVEGPMGIGIANVEIENDSLKIALTDGRSVDLGNVRGPQGDKGDRGEKGEEGTSTVFVGTWTKDKAYDPQVMVAWDGSTWIAPIGADEGDEPGKSERWRLAAMKGARGKTGRTGDIGPKGDKGDVGPKGKDGLKGDKGDKGDRGTGIEAVELIYRDEEPHLAIKWEDQTVNVPVETIRWRGQHDPRMKYAKGDVVRFAYGVWVAKQKNNGKVPTLTGFDETWDLMLGLPDLGIVSGGSNRD